MFSQLGVIEMAEVHWGCEMNRSPVLCCLLSTSDMGFYLLEVPSGWVLQLVTFIVHCGFWHLVVSSHHTVVENRTRLLCRRFGPCALVVFPRLLPLADVHSFRFQRAFVYRHSIGDLRACISGNTRHGRNHAPDKLLELRRSPQGILYLRMKRRRYLFFGELFAVWAISSWFFCFFDSLDHSSGQIVSSRVVCWAFVGRSFNHMYPSNHAPRVFTVFSSTRCLLLLVHLAQGFTWRAFFAQGVEEDRSE